MNAIDAMRSVPERVLSVKTALDGRDGVRVTIADTGVGIDPIQRGSDFQAAFYEQRARDGDGSFHLPFDH